MAVLFPLFWTVIQHGCWVRLLIGSLELFGWGSIPLLSAGVHAPVCWGFPAFALAGGAWASLFSLSRSCSGGSPRRLGGRAPVGACSWWFPFTCGWAVISALRAARERTPCGVRLLRVVALVAYAVSGYPCGCAWLVRLRGFPCVWGVFLRVRALFWVGRVVVCYLRVRSRVAVPLGCLLAVCVRRLGFVFVCCCLCCLTAIVWCAFRERSRADCDMVHASLCGCAFDGGRGCRLLFTV